MTEKQTWSDILLLVQYIKSNLDENNFKQYEYQLDQIGQVTLSILQTLQTFDTNAHTAYETLLTTHTTQTTQMAQDIQKQLQSILTTSDSLHINYNDTLQIIKAMQQEYYQTLQHEVGVFKEYNETYTAIVKALSQQIIQIQNQTKNLQQQTLTEPMIHEMLIPFHTYLHTVQQTDEQFYQEQQQKTDKISDMINTINTSVQTLNTSIQNIMETFTTSMSRLNVLNVKLDTLVDAQSNAGGVKHEE